MSSLAYLTEGRIETSAPQLKPLSWEEKFQQALKDSYQAEHPRKEMWEKLIHDLRQMEF